MIIVTALIMGTLGAGCVSVQASDTLPELTKDNALEQMMKAGETDSLVSNHKSYEATCEYILQNTKVYDYEDSEVMYVDMYGTTIFLHIRHFFLYGFICVKAYKIICISICFINIQTGEVLVSFFSVF